MPINVLHIIDKLSMDGVNPSSCAILFKEWFPHFDPNRFQLSVCTLRKPDPAGAFLEEEGIRVHYLGHGRFNFKNVTALMALIDQEQADIIHLHGYSAANFGRIASRKKGIANIVHEHAVLRPIPHQFLADFVLRNYTDMAVAVSSNVRDFMCNVRMIPYSKIHIIWNGISLEKFQQSDQASVRMKRSELDIPEDSNLVGTVTRLRKEKGTEYFIRAIPHVMKEFSRAEFIVIGDGPLRGSLEALARELRVSHQVKFVGYRRDVPELLSILDINVIPSITEGFPLTLIEAMSVGNAIVATSVGAMMDVAKNEETVLFVPPKDPVQIAKKISILLRNPLYADRLSEAAKKLSRTFTIESSAKLIANLYLRSMQHK